MEENPSDRGEHDREYEDESELAGIHRAAERRRLTMANTRPVRATSAGIPAMSSHLIRFSSESMSARSFLRTSLS